MIKNNIYCQASGMVMQCVDQALEEYDVVEHDKYREDPPRLQEIIALKKLK